MIGVHNRYVGGEEPEALRPVSDLHGHTYRRPWVATRIPAVEGRREIQDWDCYRDLRLSAEYMVAEARAKNAPDGMYFVNQDTGAVLLSCHGTLIYWGRIAT